MFSPECLEELKCRWLPNISDTGLARIVELLEKGSPLLIHGSFSRAVPMGCLATHIAWHHPQTSRLTQDAGVAWLNQIAQLNPATSRVIRAWDRGGVNDWQMRMDLLAVLREEHHKRTEERRKEPEQQSACIS